MGRLLERCMLLLGAYSFSVPVVSLVHELGHILAYLCIGITQFKLTINPFTESAAIPLVPLPSEHMLYLASAGMVFQLLFFIVTDVLIRDISFPLLVPIKICLPISLLNVGGYLIATGIEGGDTAILVSQGVPPLPLNILGVIGVALGLVSFARQLTKLGFSSDESLTELITPLFLGMGTYSVMMFVYALVTGYDLMIGLINIVTSIIFSISVGILFKRMEMKSTALPTREDAVQIVGVGLLVVCLSLLV
jgi:hypothetical protein